MNTLIRTLVAPYKQLKSSHVSRPHSRLQGQGEKRQYYVDQLESLVDLVHALCGSTLEIVAFEVNLNTIWLNKCWFNCYS